jgi:hypothetical protein
MNIRLLRAFAVAAAIICLAGCAGNGGNAGNTGGNISGDLPDLMDTLHNIDPPFEFAPMDTRFTQEGDEYGKPVEYYIGSPGIPFSEALAREAAIGAVPHSVVLLRMEPNTDIEAAKTAIRENADPWKWVCVGVDPSDVIVDSSGDLVILIISERSVDVHDAFSGLAV